MGMPKLLYYSKYFNYLSTQNLYVYTNNMLKRHGAEEEEGRRGVEETSTVSYLSMPTYRTSLMVCLLSLHRSNPLLKALLKVYD